MEAKAAPVRRITVNQLRAVCALLIDQIEESQGAELLLTKDMFWSMPAGEQYDVYVEPENLTIGQLSECWDSLEAILTERSQPVSYALVWLGEILRVLGHQSLEIT